ncbi:uncharacterized protein LOC113381066 [Ctenocephalides felis]|uniref:uncharacterized protein LOC113381066 n=1 Tax=Ctenocephalides felis TaxID=7515 RepID=UPI000E6E48CA|nr:uncharacterized protein LOC113381066 [Ctenocephalides felis]
MSEDSLHQIRVSSRNYDIKINERRLGMPAPYREMNDAFNQELERKREYDHQDLDLIVQTNVPLLNCQQKEVYDTLIKAIDNESCGLYVLDAPGGTGTTFLMSLVLATVRARTNIAVVVASSGIAATLISKLYDMSQIPSYINLTHLVTYNLVKIGSTRDVIYKWHEHLHYIAYLVNMVLQGRCLPISSETIFKDEENS